VISYLLALCLFARLHRRLGMPQLLAVAMSLQFILSPYVYGTSFRAITENLAALFVVVAVERLERFRQPSTSLRRHSS
jgi:hypothetical protein